MLECPNEVMKVEIKRIDLEIDALFHLMRNSGENTGIKHNLIIHILGDCKMDGILTSEQIAD